MATDHPQQAPTWKVVLAWLIDFGLVFFFGGYAIAEATGQATPSGFKLSGWSAFALFVVIFVYFVLGKRVFGRTLGKRILGVPR